MTYTLKREELGEGLLASVLEALAKAYKEIGAEVYVVGAAARDLSLKLIWMWLCFWRNGMNMNA